MNERAEAILVQGHTLMYSNYRVIAGLAPKHRLPSISAWREFAEAGGLMTYWSNVFDLYRRSSFYGGKVLKGARPGELPIFGEAQR